MSFIAELKRRNVFRVAVAYVVAGWLLLQATEVMSGLLELPAVFGKGVVLALALGFLPVLAFAWAFELTPEGLKREREVDRSQSVAGQTGRKLNALIIAMLVVSTAYFFWESRLKTPPAAEPAATAEAADTQIPVPATPVKDDKSIAVLPFVNMSAEEENAYFADGLSEEILNQLAQVAGLRVIGRTSSFAFKGQNRDLREIGQVLGAATLLEGSVRRQGEQVRVTAQLIAADDGAHLWSQNFDRRLDDVFAIQDEIAEQVVEALGIVLDDASRKAMLTAGVRDVEAFVAYQRAYRLSLDAHGSDDMYGALRSAHALYDQAIAAAPDFAQAYLEKTDYYAHVVLDISFPRTEREAALATMRELLGQAYEKAREPRRKLTIEADRLFFSDDWTRLPGVLDTLFDTPGCADGNWIELAVPFAPSDKLTRHFERRIACDPLFALSYMFLAELKMREGDLDGAEATLAIARSLPGNKVWLQFGELQLALGRGQAEQALTALREEIDGVPSNRQALRLIRYLGALGRVDEVRETWSAMQSGGYNQASMEIVVNALIGDRAAANAAAARLDAEPGGTAELVRTVNYCYCGAPFDLDSTPRLARRLEEAGWTWPPYESVSYPAKDW